MEKVLALAQQYRIDIAHIGQYHYKAAELADAKRKLLGVPAVVLSSIVATSIFATISFNPDTVWRIVAGSVGILAAAASALQIFFKYDELAERHRRAGAEYGSLRRRLDLFLARFGVSDTNREAEALTELEAIRVRLTELAENMPPVPRRAYKRALAEMAAERGELPTSIGRLVETPPSGPDPRA